VCCIARKVLRFRFEFGLKMVQNGLNTQTEAEYEADMINGTGGDE